MAFEIGSIDPYSNTIFTVSARPWCPEGTVPMPDGCVEFIDEAMTWQEASDTCADKRGRLPMVKDDEDINLLKALRSKYGK